MSRCSYVGSAAGECSVMKEKFVTFLKKEVLTVIGVVVGKGVVKYLCEFRTESCSDSKITMLYFLSIGTF